MSYTDNGESPLIDPGQPCYEPTLTNVSTEVATPSTFLQRDLAKTKKKKVTNIIIIATGSRLPELCPQLSERTKVIISNGIKGNKRFYCEVHQNEHDSKQNSRLAAQSPPRSSKSTQIKWNTTAIYCRSHDLCLLLNGARNIYYRFFMLREAVIFYEGICPHPSGEEYTIMAKIIKG